MTDPVEVFPPEVLSPLFSLFNNQELQILSSISKSWRRQILTDVIIHRILDLTEIKRNLSEDEIIELVKRLASLSSYPRNEIRLLLQPFWKTFEKLLTSNTTSEHWPQQIKATFDKFGSLLSAIASSTKGKLSGLHLYLSFRSSQVPKGDSAAIFASAILERVFILTKLMKELDSISLKVPLPVSLNSEGENGGKRFRIDGDEDCGKASWRFDSFMALIRKTIDFTGFGLTGFGVDLDRFPCLPTGEIDFDAVEKIFKQVDASSSVLRALTLYGLESADVSQHALDIVSKCPNLSSLTLLLRGDSNQQKQLEFPKHSSTSSLVKLTITLYRLSLDWNSSLLLEWIGSRWKTLWIDQGGSPAQLPVEALKSILNQNPLLQIVSIQESNISISSIRSTANSLNLPHLKELTLGKFDHVQELVAGASIADLRVLRLYPRCSTGTVQRGSAISHFSLIFECCHKTIEYLWTGDMYAPVLSVPDANVYNQLDFPRLRVLEITRNSVGFFELLSSHTLPNLQSFTMRGGMIVPEYVVKILSQSFSSLHQIKLVGRGSGKDQYQKSLGKGSFPCLSVIELGEGSDCIWEFFAQASFGNLKTLVVSNANLFSEGDHELSSMQDIINIITSNCSSLVKVELGTVVDEMREESKGQGKGKGKGKKKRSAKTSRLESQSLEQLSFPCLTSFSIKSISAAQFPTFYTFVSFFAQLQYPVLINLEVLGEGSAKERASLAQMMKVFKSNASLVGKGIRQE